MNVKTIGLIILITVLLIFLYSGFNYVIREKVVDKGNVQITKDNDHMIKWSPFIGIGVIVISGSILLYGKKRES